MAMSILKRRSWMLAPLVAALAFGGGHAALAQGHEHTHGDGGWHGGGWHGGHWHGGPWYGWGGPYWGWGWPYYYGYGYPYYYPYDYPYDYDYGTYPAAPAYQPPGVAAQQAPATWYYCSDPRGYYPYVRSCNGPWQPVPATPPGMQ
jgi:hypothetical protein